MGNPPIVPDRQRAGRAVMSSLAEHLCAMARNNAWANYRLLEACAKLSEADYRARAHQLLPLDRADPEPHPVGRLVLSGRARQRRPALARAVRAARRALRELRRAAARAGRGRSPADRLLRAADRRPGGRHRDPQPAGRAALPRAHPGRAGASVPARHPPPRPGPRDARRHGRGAAAARRVLSSRRMPTCVPATCAPWGLARR